MWKLQNRRDGDLIATAGKGLFTYSDLLASKQYRYKVIAFNANGCESEFQVIDVMTLLNTPDD